MLHKPSVVNAVVKDVCFAMFVPTYNLTVLL